MNENEVTRALDEMREAQTILGRMAIAKRDSSGLRQAQANIDAIDRALTEERVLLGRAAAEESARQAAKLPGSYEAQYGEFAEDRGPLTL